MMKIITEQHIAFKGEAQLAGWTDSHTGGAKVTLWLSDPAELEHFRQLTVRAGGKSGQRMMIVMVQIDDDEQPLLQPSQQPALLAPPASDPAKKGGPLARLAGMWRANADFQRWVADYHPESYVAVFESFESPSLSEVVTELIYQVCGVESLAQLDHEAIPARRFDAEFRQPFMASLSEG